MKWKVIILITVILIIGVVSIFLLSDSREEIMQSQQLSLNSITEQGDTIRISQNSKVLQVTEKEKYIEYRYGEDLVQIAFRPIILGQEYKHNGLRNGTNQRLRNCNTNLTRVQCPELRLLNYKQNMFNTEKSSVFEWEYRPVNNKTNNYRQFPYNKTSVINNIYIRSNRILIHKNDTIKAGRINLDFSDLREEISVGTRIKPQAWNIKYNIKGNKAKITPTLKKIYRLKLSDMIFLDPIVTIDELGLELFLQNVTAEKNFTHLEISDNSPYDTLILYHPMDIQIPASNGDTGVPPLTGATTYDYTKNNINGGLIQDDGEQQYLPPLHKTGYIGKGYFFEIVPNDGRLRGLNLGTPAIIDNMRTDLTVMAWIKSDDVTDGNQVIFASGNVAGSAVSSKIELRATSTAPRPLFRVSNGTDFISVGVSASDEIENDKWFHITGVYNGTNTLLYINGTLVATSSALEGFGLLNTGTSVDDVGIGFDARNKRFPFNGTIDEVMLFNSSLTSAQINSIYLNQSARFKPIGLQTLKQINITNGNNRLNISVSSYQNLHKTNISVAIREWNITRGYNETTGSDLGLNLTAYFHFDNSFNSSINSVNGTPINGVTLDQNGEWNGSSAFDGSDDYIEITDTTDFDNPWDNGGSLSFWIYPNTGGESNAGFWITKNNLWYLKSNDPSSTSPGIEFNIAWSGTAGRWRDSGAIISNLNFGKWNHIAFVYNSSSTTNNPNLYVNNIKYSLTQILVPTGTPNSDTGSLQLMSNPATSRAMNGSMDELMIYRRILNEDEVGELYVRSRAKYTPISSYENLTSEGQNITFVISNETTSISTIFKLESLNETFYTPNLGGDDSSIIFDFHSVSETTTPTPDTTPPAINFTNPTPTNGTNQNNKDIFVNVSSSDDSDHYTFVDFNRDNLLRMDFEQLNETGQPLDNSTYQHKFSFTDSAFSNSSGRYGNSSWFTLVTDGVVSDSSDLWDDNTFNSGITISAWVNPSQVPPIVNADIFSSEGDLRLQMTTTSNYKFDIANDALVEGVTGTSPIELNKWVHIVGVYNITDLLIYVNGTLENTASSTFAPGFSFHSRQTAIGNGYSGFGNEFNGSIDEVLLFNRTFSSTEILALYNASTQYSNNFTNLSNKLHVFTGYAIDSEGNKNQTEDRFVNISTISNPYPTYSSLTEFPSDPTIYSSGKTYEFNSTWIDETAMDTVIITFDGTNYSVTNVSSVYHFNISDLSVGTYTYSWFGNDSSGNVNNTGDLTYTINRATIDLTLLLNDTNGDIKIVYPSQVNASSNSENGTLTLLKDGTDITSLNGIFQELASGYYNFTSYIPQTQNFTGLSITRFANITKATPTGSIVISPSITVTYPTETTATATETNTNDGDIIYTLYRDNVAVSNPEINTLGVAVYSYKYNSTEGENYTGIILDTDTLTVNQNNTNLLSLSLSPSSVVTYPTETTATGSGCLSELTCILFRDNISVSNPEINTLGVAVYSYKYNTTGNINYSSMSISDTLTININSSSSVFTFLNGSRSDINIINGSTIDLNGTLQQGEGEIQLFNNGTLINEGPSPLFNATTFDDFGSFNITTLLPGNENFTSVFETWFVNVTGTIAPLPPQANASNVFIIKPNLENSVPYIKIGRTLQFA